MSSEEQELVRKIEDLMRRKYGAIDGTSMKRLFDDYDSNHDGKIDRAELTRLLSDADIGNALTRGAWVSGIMERLDKNADKTISWDEFKHATGNT